MVIPGSHKCNFPRPESLFNGGLLGSELPEHTVNITPEAGDAVIFSELLTHGAMPWKAQDKKRVVLALRYAPQYRGGDFIPESVKGRLSPETLELMAPGPYWEEKEIVSRDIVSLS